MGGLPNPDSAFRQAIQDDLFEALSDGQSLVAVCKREGMPSVRTVQHWANGDEEFASQLTRAREAGYLIRGERAVESAKDAEDASLGRLAFDAERWYLGKLSNAFSDNKAQKLEHKHSVDPEVAEWLGHQTS